MALSELIPVPSGHGSPARTRSTRVAGLVMALVAALILTTVQASPAHAADRYRQEIVNRASRLRADVIWGSTAPYQGVFLWPDNSSASQEFDILDSGGGYFRIRARHSGQCLMLDWRAGYYANGTPIIQYPYCSSGYGPAEWRTRWISGTTCSGSVCTTGVDHMLLVNRQTGRCLDANNPYGGAPPVQAVLQQWDCVTAPNAWNMGNQAWDILPPGAVPID